MKVILFALLLTLPLYRSSQAQINGSFNFDGLNRSYIIHLPIGYSPGMNLPLVFVLHGFTQTAGSIQTASGFNAVSDSNNFIAVYANGVNNGWNVKSGMTGASTADDVGFINALIDTMAANYSIDLNRVYTCGFSAGGFLSHRLACESANRFAAIASVSGVMSDSAYNACQPSRKIPVLQIHGTSDFVVSYNGGSGNKSVMQVLDFWKTFENCPSTPVLTPLPDLVNEGSTVERQSWNPCDDNSTVELLKISSGGHTWPGSAGFSGIGNTNMDINASQEIWDFFNRFSLVTARTAYSPGKENWTIFPNPARENLQILGEGFFNLQVKNMAGQNVPFSRKGNLIGIENLSSGLYFFMITDETGAISRIEKIRVE